MNALGFCPNGTVFHVYMMGLFHGTVEVSSSGLDLSACVLRSGWRPMKNYRVYSNIYGQPIGHYVTHKGELVVL